ncbi:flagellar hook-associated protein FlgK [Gottfriedia solisilvae]|uniref:Flagellar hook-associated protein 1 n=1 Tax=Gottfriedia solisilvae TaxID=1516104 RepID=A0A8J3AL06_9BACI|nr:flagellar hook-associated protein FlgK [Gottfriedia solisilvae]GGI16527.1 flagellar hook-associated protein 1 [Gottfriedia solisilvae]
MRPTFMGLETAKRGMYTQQSALSVLGHNIANANTEGYTRQRANMQQTSPFPGPGMERPYIPGQIGTGSEVTSIQRIRESFLDIQYRNDNSQLGYYASRNDALQKMEDIMNEPSEQGLSKTLDRFWQSLQDLSLNPSNSGARAVVLERGKAVAETFNYLSTSLKTVQNDQKNQIEVETKNINSLLNQIQNVNRQIADVEPHGMLPNDLYDERDRLIDKLSNLVNIKVTYSSSGGHSLPTAEGKATIDLVAEDGTVIESGRVIDGIDIKTDPKFLKVNYDSTTGLVDTVSIGNNIIDVEKFNGMGKLNSLIKSFGYLDSTNAQVGLYPEMLKNLDDIANTFATTFNTVHAGGITLGDVNGGNFFGSSAGPINASNIKVLITNINDIAAGSTTSDGDGKNALLLADVMRRTDLSIGTTTNTSITAFYQGIIGGMGVQSQEANRLMTNSGILVDSVDQHRKSVSSVSLDEEMTDMVKFQHAYNAAARNITVIDEMLDKIINGMGIVGR